VIQLLVHAVENRSRVFKAKEEGAHATLLLRWQKVVPARDRTCSFTEPLNTQHFTANRPDEFFASSVARTAE